MTNSNEQPEKKKRKSPKPHKRTPMRHRLGRANIRGQAAPPLLGPKGVHPKKGSPARAKRDAAVEAAAMARYKAWRIVDEAVLEFVANTTLKDAWPDAPGGHAGLYAEAAYAEQIGYIRAWLVREAWMERPAAWRKLQRRNGGASKQDLISGAHLKLMRKKRRAAAKAQMNRRVLAFAESVAHELP